MDGQRSSGSCSNNSHYPSFDGRYHIQLRTPVSPDDLAASALATWVSASARGRPQLDALDPGNCADRNPHSHRKRCGKRGELWPRSAGSRSYRGRRCTSSWAVSGPYVLHSGWPLAGCGQCSRPRCFQANGREQPPRCLRDGSNGLARAWDGSCLDVSFHLHESLPFGLGVGFNGLARGAAQQGMDGRASL
jgi:hypothetical protein